MNKRQPALGTGYPCHSVPVYPSGAQQWGNPCGMRPEHGVHAWTPRVLPQQCVVDNSRPEQLDHLLCREEARAQHARGPSEAEPCLPMRLGPLENAVKRPPRAPLILFWGRAKKTI